MDQVQYKPKRNPIVYIIVALVFLFVSFSLTIYYFVDSDVLGTSTLSADSSEPKKSIFKEEIERPLYDDPKRLFIADTNIDMNVIRVGTDDDGKLENPSNWEEGGWYKRSSKPGEDGNIIINAHYDTNFSTPAAFWELKSVKENDNVYLVDKLGKVYTYKVTELFYVDIQDPNRLSIFDDVEGKSELTLITCGGVWQPQLGTYNKRLVVKAELDETSATAFVASN